MLKKVKIKNLYGVLYFIILVIPALIYKMYLKISKKELWLIAETEKTARDNGFTFFEYVTNNHKEIKCYYAISFKCRDYARVKSYENVIKWSSMKHYFLYMSSTYNISAHKDGNPNHPLFTIMHLYLNLYNNRIFLQHGVLYQNFEMFHQKNTKFKIFITGAKPEYEFVKSKYGYNNNEVRYTGLARFDNWYKRKDDYKKNLILYIPTWRRWFKDINEFEQSLYYTKIKSFINNKELEQVLKDANFEMYFCPHIGIERFNDLFKSSNEHVKILNIKDTDIQKLLIEGTILITDFSSLHTDFAFMNKKIIYYQYDEKDYKEKHIGKFWRDTYYDFEKDGFGPVVKDEESLINEIKRVISIKEKNIERYEKRIDNFFELHDEKNCERIFNEIRSLNNGKKEHKKTDKKR